MKPRTIDEYLDQLREAMHDDDPALVQDALYDAEEYLRAELAEQPGRPVAEALAEIAETYGAPAEVADAYRQTERTVTEALRTPARAAPRSMLGTVFGVFIDPRSYAAIFYMLLALATGIVYFTIAVTGLSVSLGLAITLIGIPFFLLFLGVVRVLSLLEGRIVEVMLGVRMPRRPLYPRKSLGFWQRVGNMLTDSRTWTTILYMIVQLPLGILYFVTVVVGFSVSLTAMLAPLAAPITLHFGGTYYWFHETGLMPAAWQLGLLSVVGFIGLLLTMHLCRAIGQFHGGIAKYLLVRV